MGFWLALAVVVACFAVIAWLIEQWPTEAGSFPVHPLVIEMQRRAEWRAYLDRIRPEGFETNEAR